MISLIGKGKWSFWGTYMLSELEEHLDLYFLEHQETLNRDFYFITLRNLEEYSKIFVQFIF